MKQRINDWRLAFAYIVHFFNEWYLESWHSESTLKTLTTSITLVHYCDGLGDCCSLSHQYIKVKIVMINSALQEEGLVRICTLVCYAKCAILTLLILIIWQKYFLQISCFHCGAILLRTKAISSNACAD